jgi:hypothetical protein
MPLQTIQERPIDTHPSWDETCDDNWIDSHVDRLLGFEILYRELTGNPDNLKPRIICEKIGVHPTFTHRAVGEFIDKFKNL